TVRHSTPPRFPCGITAAVTGAGIAAAVITRTAAITTRATGRITTRATGRITTRATAATTIRGTTAITRGTACTMVGTTLLTTTAPATPLTTGATSACVGQRPTKFGQDRNPDLRAVGQDSDRDR